MVFRRVLFRSWVVCGRLCIGRVEQQARREARAPPCGDLPVLSLDVVDDCGRGPAQERRNDKTHAFARARGREGQDMLWPFVAQVLAIMLAEEYAGRLREARLDRKSTRLNSSH